MKRLLEFQHVGDNTIDSLLKPAETCTVACIVLESTGISLGGDTMTDRQLALMGCDGDPGSVLLLKTFRASKLEGQGARTRNRLR